jgi:hypothetical protein
MHHIVNRLSISGGHEAKDVAAPLLYHKRRVIRRRYRRPGPELELLEERLQKHEQDDDRVEIT